MLGRDGKQIILLGVPQTYPPKPINGCMVTDFLTPSTKSEYTYPSELKPEVERVSGGYVLDVEDFRTPDKEALLKRVYAKTEKHFRVAKHLIRTKPWDFFMMVELGVDRIHHGFWSYMDPTHPKYEAGNPFEHAIRDYYRYVDREVAELLDLTPNDTVVMVVSDHGAKKMDGGICFNEWLIQQGFLSVVSYPDQPTPIDKVTIDWSKTKAWGDGGYYGRLFLNVRGREPQGTVAPEDYERVREDLIERIAAITDPQGRNLGSRAYRPQALYRTVNGVPPDLIVYFGDLHWRSVGSVGLGSMYTFDNDTGPDEANHDWHGIFILNEVGCRRATSSQGIKKDCGCMMWVRRSSTCSACRQTRRLWAEPDSLSIRPGKSFAPLVAGVRQGGYRHRESRAQEAALPWGPRAPLSSSYVLKKVKKSLPNTTTDRGWPQWSHPMPHTFQW